MDNNNKFGYFYGLEADKYTFCRIPKALIKDSTFKGLSTDAKLLYGLLLDRMSLSVKNRWFDEKNRVYIRGQLIMLNSDHIEYIIECLQQTRRPIKNIKSYLLKALINAPDTIDDYYLLQTKIDADQLYNRAQ